MAIYVIILCIHPLQANSYFLPSNDGKKSVSISKKKEFEHDFEDVFEISDCKSLFKLFCLHPPR